MRNLLILGGGTAGTITANKLRRTLPSTDWTITVVDADDHHRYQPGYLLLPFGTYTPDKLTRSRRASLRSDVTLVYGDIDRVIADANHVLLGDGRLFG